MLTFCKCRALAGTLNHTLKSTASRIVRSVGLDGKLIMLAMRITAAILLIFSLHVTAKSVSQTITLSGKDIPLKTVFDEIRKQSGYVVFYNNEIIEHAKPVTINAEDQPLAEFLDNTLHQQGLDYEIQNKTIVLKKNEGGVKSLEKNPPVTGVVRGPDGQPLAGVNVVVKGTKMGAVTDKDGRFTIEVEEGLVLEFTSVGFGKKEIKVNGSQELIVSMQISVSPLDEVQYIAYGQTSKRFSVGNVSTVKAADIERQPVNNSLLALQGKVPGLFIEQATGLPGSGVSVRIQGQNSIRSGNDPLYVIDGVPYISLLLPNIGGVLGRSGNAGDNQATLVGSGGNPLSFINPSDIESIDILKDADATAIYGSRAANGAILITTKKGKAGSTSTNFTLRRGVGEVGSKLKLLNTQQYLQMRMEAKNNDNAPIYPNDYDINGFWDTTRNNDWQKELIGGTAQYTDIHSNISGGNNNTQFLFGAGYHKETTVFPGDLNDRKGSVHFNTNHTSVNKKFRLRFNGNYLVDENRLINQDLTSNAISLAPNAPSLFAEDGSLNWMLNGSGSSTWTNPLSYLNSKYNNITSNLIGNASIGYQLLDGLSIGSSFGYFNFRSKEVITVPLVAVAPEWRPFSQRSAAYNDGNASSWIIEPQATLTRSFGNAKFEGLIGATIQQRFSKQQWLQASGFNNDAVLEDIRSAAMISVLNSLNSVYKYNALFGRLNYILNEKYIINLTARRDGSSRFGPENRFHNFGSVGAAWIFSNERYFQKKGTLLSYGKLRVSFGTTGNDQIDDYNYLNRYFPTPGLGYQNMVGLGVNNLPNPYLEWEETKKLQAGLDLGFLLDRVILSISYYKNRSTNQLLPYALPWITGFNSILYYNFPANVQNSGWEMSLTATLQKSKNFNWTTSLNLTVPKNRLIDFPNLSTSAYATSLTIGEPITIYKVYNLVGVDETTGIYQFRDKNKNITSTPNFDDDRHVLINTSPTLYAGIQSSFKYKSLELNVLFQFVRQKGPNYSLGNMSGASFNLNHPETVLRRWQKPGDITSVQRYNSDYSLILQSYFASQSDQSYSDASYTRLKNLSLSWQLPQVWTKRVSLKRVDIILQAQNLLTLTDYDGLDPETKSSSVLPPLRVLTLGFNVTL